MRTILCLFSILAICFMSGCSTFMEEFFPSEETGENIHQDVEIQGRHYAKLNSIACLNYPDMEIVKSADVGTIDNMVREQRCFVLPTDAGIYIKERLQGGIVSIKYTGSTRLFYTLKSNLVAD